MMVAFLRSLTLFGTPAILALPGNFHTITTKIWSLFQYPPNPGSPPRPRSRCSCSPSCCCGPSAGCSGGAAMP